jgi:hypothetical protein
VWQDAAEVSASRRLWAAVMLTTDVEVCRSILLGRRVRACQLDAEALQRARRGEPFPPPSDYIAVTAEMFDAVAEGGPFESKARTR